VRWMSARYARERRKWPAGGARYVCVCVSRDAEANPAVHERLFSHFAINNPAIFVEDERRRGGRMKD